MGHDNEEAVRRVAEQLANGDPVDWREAGADLPDSDPRLERLQALEKVMVAHRESPRAPLRSRDVTAETAPARIGDGVTAAANASSLTTWGHLRNLEKVGEGSFGEVYRAFDPELQTEVALKLLRADARRDEADEGRFLDEARRLARVRHPNVVVVHGADRHAGRVGFWSELLPGRTLEESLVRQGRFGAREAASIGLDLCRALAAVHAAGVIHRDVKTSNVMREEGGRIVLMDLGSGGELGAAGEGSAGDHLYGTPLAMAPEQLLGQVAGPSTDIYGLGALLYRLVSKQYPVEAASLPELVEKHRRRDWVPLRDRRPDLPGDFIKVVERAIEPEPARRYQSAGAMERALEATLGASALPTETQPGPWSPRLPGEPVTSPATLGRPRRLSVALVLAMVGALGTAVLLGPDVVRRLAREQGKATPSDAGSPITQDPEGKQRPSAGTGPVEPTVHEPAAAPLTARATLYRITGSVEQPLVPGARISPGDRLFMEVEGSSEMYVYVLNEDQDGNVFVLFPLPGLDLANPLPPGTRLRLPGRLGGSAFNWQVTSAGGRESVIAIASRQPLGDLERDIAGFPRVDPGRPVNFGKVSTGALRTLRGIGGLVGEAPAGQPEGGRRLSQALRSLPERTSARGDLWVWQMELENPGR